MLIIGKWKKFLNQSFPPEFPAGFPATFSADNKITILIGDYKMKTFVVGVQEIWIQPVRIQAETLEEALVLVTEGEGKQIASLFEYSHTEDTTEDWEIHEETESEKGLE
jgi:hypothetical protein